jgi:hypothetical protein
MITESQYRTFMKEYSKNGGVISHAAMKAQMTHKTAARYLKVQAGPAAQRQARQPRNYRTREDPMVRLRPEVECYLDSTPELALVPKAFWEHLVATRPELAKDVPLRTFQRAMHQWRAHHGPPKEVFFPQAREPGRSVQYDWFSANELGITIAGQPFRHLLGHAVLPFSNWEWAVPCQSESSLSLRTGVQAGLWAFGGVPHELWTDNSCTATHTLERGKPGRDFNESYLEFCRHLRVTPHTINVAKPHEQGDVETAHRHLARRIQNHLLLRANRDFGSEAEYRVFLARICAVANQLRAPKVEEERRALRALPASRYPESDCHVVPVSSFSTVKVKQATYSVPSRLIGLRVQAFVSEQEVAFFYERTEVARLSRAQGQQARIDFRHIIAWLVRNHRLPDEGRSGRRPDMDDLTEWRRGASGHPQPRGHRVRNFLERGRTADRARQGRQRVCNRRGHRPHAAPDHVPHRRGAARAHGLRLFARRAFYRLSARCSRRHRFVLADLRSRCPRA